MTFLSCMRQLPNSICTFTNNKYIWMILDSTSYWEVISYCLLELKKEDIHLDEQWFQVTQSKTESGIRRVPIADSILPFFQKWYDYSEADTLLCTPDMEPFKYRNYYDSYWKPLIENLNLGYYTPHCTRHTCISLLAEARVDQTSIKKIVGHAGAMTLTERVYTHLDIGVLIAAVNQMYVPEGHRQVLKKSNT